MIFFNPILIFCLAFSIALISGMPTNDDDKRGGTSGLFPFPRVGRSWLYPGLDITKFPRGSRGRGWGLISQPRTGRSQPEKTWNLSPEDYPDYHDEMKRQGLIPFPRVGRAIFERAGKDFRISNENDPWTMIALREVPSPRDFIPRLEGESDEPQMGNDQLKSLRSH
ncbi:cardio acceleratory peptide capability [Arctopsyche grandis]|uniref:cardio acceleratory peptide capability n=1 Tax=Arctopsyche grandis TaxID=121162 RepID=UPI00406D9F1C